MNVFRKNFFAAFKKFLGVLLVTLGFIAMLVPFVPGILFVFAGLYISQKENYRHNTINGKHQTTRGV